MLAQSLQRVLLVRLRSIGDTVLMTPVLEALKNWSPKIHISVVSEPLSAPILENHPLVDQLIVVHRTRKFWRDAVTRARLVLELRSGNYDIAFNFHGGTTAAWLCRLSGASRRVGYALPNTKFLLTDVAPPPQEIWGKPTIHSVEQQLALLKFCGIPLPDQPHLSLTVDQAARTKVHQRLYQEKLSSPYAVFHPAAAFATKQWAAVHFARVIEHVAQRGLHPVVLVARFETATAEAIHSAVDPGCSALFVDDFSLSESMALIADCSLFVGNDSGPAHIAAAFHRPQVVIFGSSNEMVWGPWTTAPHQIVRKVLPCVPCAGYTCHAFSEPECIKQVAAEEVIQAVEAVLSDWIDTRS